MMGDVDRVNFAIAVSGLTLCFLGFAQALAVRSMEKRAQRYFVAFFSLLSAYVGANLLGQLSQGVRLQMTTLFLESALSSVLMLLLMGFLLEQGGEDGWRHSGVFRAAAGLWLVYLVMLVSTLFSGQIYYFDGEGVYHRGPYYAALLVPPVLIMLLNLFLLWRRRERFSRKARRAFAAYILLPMACMVLQMRFFGIFIIVLGTSLAAMVMFLYIQQEQTEGYIEKEKEIVRLQTDMMLSQIQPHFLHNALEAIQDL